MLTKILMAIGCAVLTSTAVMADPPPAFHQPPGSPIALEREALARNAALRSALRRSGFAAGFHRGMMPKGCELFAVDPTLPLAVGNARIACSTAAPTAAFTVACDDGGCVVLFAIE